MAASRAFVVVASLQVALAGFATTSGCGATEVGPNTTGTAADTGASDADTGTGSVSGSATSTESGEDTGGTATPCTADVEVMGDGADPAVRGTVTGENGTFEDRCDASGDLIEYVCETRTECVDPPNPICRTYQTGQVVERPFDCAGTCMDGHCEARCFMIGDVMVYVEIGADTAVFDDLADGRRYTCTLLFDASTDTFDCNTGPQVGDQVEITSLGLSGPFCTGGQIGNFGIGAPETCAYGCTLE